MLIARNISMYEVPKKKKIHQQIFINTILLRQKILKKRSQHEIGERKKEKYNSMKHQMITMEDKRF